MKTFEIYKPVFGRWMERYSDGRDIRLDGITGLKVCGTLEAKSEEHAIVVAKRLGHTMPIVCEEKK